jgi:YidC/Oxa1 family membrane protein insertase
MLDGLFELISGMLNFFYTHVPGGYAVAIALLTCVVMIVTTPLTLKGTRSMIEMQRLQPEIRRLQIQYKDDRQKLNEELMRFYREHEINPVGGCLPLLIQAPVFSILFYVVRGLTQQARFVGLQEYARDVGVTRATGEPLMVTDGFRPKYLDHSSELYQSLLGKHEMNWLGIDLAISPAVALSQSFVTALPYLALVAVIAFLSWYQQKQIMGRTAGAEVTQQQRLMMRIGPLLYVFFAFVSPLAIGIYFLVSTLWRVGQQAFITRSLYRGEDSIGRQAQKAMADMRAARKAEGNGAKGERATPKKAADSPSGNGRTRAQQGSGQPKSGQQRPKARSGTGGGAKSSSGGGAAAPKPHPRSRKKRKRK